MHLVPLVVTLLVLSAHEASARQESILSPSAENELRRAPVNLNPDLRRSLLRALYYLEAEYQQHQAQQAGRSYPIPITGEYHKSAPEVLKDPALRRALLRVLIHLEADDLDKRSRENAAPFHPPAQDANNAQNTIKNYMETNFGNVARLSSAHQRAAAVLQSLENTPGPLPRIEDYFNFAQHVHNRQQPNQRRQVQQRSTARPPSQQFYKADYRSNQVSTPSSFQAQSSTPSPYQVQPTQSPYQAQLTQSPYQAQPTHSPYQAQPTQSPYQAQPTQSPYHVPQTQSPYTAQQTQSLYQSQTGTDNPYQPQPSTQSPYQPATHSTYSPQPVTQSPFDQQQSTPTPYQPQPPTALSAYLHPSAPSNYQQPPPTAQAYQTDSSQSQPEQQMYNTQASSSQAQPTQPVYHEGQQVYEQQNHQQTPETTVAPNYQEETKQNYQEQQPDPTQQPQSNIQDFSNGQDFNQQNHQVRSVLPLQNYHDGQLALNFRNDDALTTASPNLANHNFNGTTETPTTTFDYYQTVTPTDEYPTAQPNASSEYEKQINSYIFQSPDPLDEASDNAIKPLAGHELRSADSTNVAPTVETAAPQTEETAPPPTQPPLTSSTTVSTTTEIEDFKIYKAPLQLAFTVHQGADGRPHKIEPLYDPPPVPEEEKLKQQQYYIDEQIRTLRELQAKHRDLLKLRQLEQERLRTLKKAQLLSSTAKPQDSTTLPPQPSTEQTASTSTPATTSSTTPEANVQIHYSQGDVERQKQIQELERQQQERQRQIEEELAKARKQQLIDALERERQQKLLEAENERQRQLQQAYEERQQQRLQLLEQQRLASIQNEAGISILRSVEFPSQPQHPLSQNQQKSSAAPVSTTAPIEPSEEQKLTYRSFQQEPPPLPNFAIPQTTSFGSFQQSPAAIQSFNSFVPSDGSVVQFQPFQPSIAVPSHSTSIQPSVQVSTQTFPPVLPQAAPPVATRTNRQEPFGSTANLGFNARFSSANNPSPINFFTDNVHHQHRVRALDGQLQTLLHQSGISAPPEDLNIVSKILALNHERPDQIPTFSLF